jgi:uncharacterized protein (TIGR02996 family)
MSNVGLEAILALPADDAPRLVWADCEGGARGELVVVQCALAGRALSREDRRRLKARETQLLAESWRFDGLGRGMRGTFVRGFVERVSMDFASLSLEALDDLWTRAPLCSFLQLGALSPNVSAEEGPRPEAAWAEVAERLAKAFAAFPQARVLGISASAVVHEPDESYLSEGISDDPGSWYGFGDDFVRLVASAASLSSLTDLCIYRGELTARAIPQLARLPRLRRLHGDLWLRGADAVALLRAVPSLRQFGPWSSGLRGAELKTLLDTPEVERLTELDLADNSLGEEDLVELGSCAKLSGLERLGLAGLKSSFGSGLRVLEAHDARVDRADVEALVSMPSLEWVRLSVGPDLKAALEAVIPDVRV